MIRVKKDLSLLPPGLESNLAHQWTARALEEKERHEANNRVYRHESVVEALDKIYAGKCGWCETYLGVSSPLIIDHYRPKKAVKNDAGHPGYYWLSYEWSNLISCCSTCNNRKSHSFPLTDENNRVRHPPDDRTQWRADSESMLKESPLLLHPEIDFPDEIIGININGVILEKNGSSKGKATIELCDLNRPKLISERKKIIIGFRKSLWHMVFFIKDLVEKGRMNKEEFLSALKEEFLTGFNWLLEIGKPEQQYSSVGKSMLENFDKFFIETLPDEDTREILEKAFKQFSDRLQEGAKNAAR